MVKYFFVYIISFLCLWCLLLRLFCYSLLLIVCLYSTCQMLSCSVSLVANIPNILFKYKGPKSLFLCLSLSFIHFHQYVLYQWCLFCMVLCQEWLHIYNRLRQSVWIRDWNLISFFFFFSFLLFIWNPYLQSIKATCQS